MAAKRGRERSNLSKIDEENRNGCSNDSSDGSVLEVSSMGSAGSDSQKARLMLRGRWELASVLNFLHVFQPIIKNDLEISAEEIETALIAPNNALAHLHICLLKGIPPVSKSLTESGTWVTVLCKKLAPWWPWVAEGEVPLVTAHGAEISMYKELDPTIRLLILKALCEIRAEQDDTLMYIDDALKNGSNLSTFRKDRIGGDENGTAYWYDGDSVIGYRLYKEVNKVEYKLRLKGKGQKQPIISFHWETLATNLDEFQEISDKFSSSGNIVEFGVGKRVKNEYIPVLEELQKRKERVLKRQQKKAMQLDSYLNSQFLSGRSLRDRKPVSYTFDEYDRTIDEAIQITKEGMTTHEQKDEGKIGESATNPSSVTSNGSLHSDMELADSSSRSDGPTENKNRVNLPENVKTDDIGDDDDDDDYCEDDENDDDDDDDSDNGGVGDDNGNLDNSNKENGHLGWRKGSKHNQRQRDLEREGVGLRRSKRTAASMDHQKDDMVNSERENGDDIKKRLRHGQPTRDNRVNDIATVSNSEDGEMDTNSQRLIDLNEAVPDCGMECANDVFDDGDGGCQIDGEEEDGAH